MKPPYPTDCPPDNQRETNNDSAKDWYDFVPPAPSTTATLAFNLDDPDGLRRLVEYLDAPKWKSAVREFDQWLRNKIKYNDADLPERQVPDEGIEWLQIARDELWKRSADNGIDIWEE